MTGPEHYREAERLLAAASAWMDADLGWKAHLSAEERLAFRSADLATAQVHSTLAVAAATALVDETPRGDSFREYRAWLGAASGYERGEAE
ncbi:hypothetical protein AB0K09_04175 [Streptomyces sp. NPDC049577]|uniref:hypothetical protein n=1 Tax=Streptomyces sp. NPDC049577 TaxID=3155153 RepID=UPI003436BD9E